MYYYSLLKADCLAVRDAWDFAMGYPFWPGHPSPPNSGQQALLAAWLEADSETKESLEQSGAYNGWSLHQQATFPEDPPGTRWYIEIPDDFVTVVIPQAMQSFNRTLSLQQLQTLQAAASVATENLPANWTQPE